MPPPIAALDMSTAAFLGRAPRLGAPVLTPRLCDGWAAFAADFAPPPGAVATDLALAVRGFFDNGGRRCVVVNLGPAGDLAAGLTALERHADVGLVAAPGLSAPDDHAAILAHCERLGDRLALLDAADSGDAAALARPAAEGGLRPRASAGGMGAVHVPHLRVPDPFGAPVPRMAPPSGHVAGAYAGCDARRGIHRVPSDVALAGVLDVSQRFAQHAEPALTAAGVNVIRAVPGRGIRIWGARTLAPAGSEWLYVPVRRLAMMIVQSIRRGTAWTLAEPNGPALWAAVEGAIHTFLAMLWQAGALQGDRPQDAFLVRCDARTNTPDVTAAGRVAVQVGIATLRPGEFVMLRLTLRAAM